MDLKDGHLITAFNITTEAMRNEQHSIKHKSNNNAAPIQQPDAYRSTVLQRELKIKQNETFLEVNNLKKEKKK
jgi:hypothetical protein